MRRSGRRKDVSTGCLLRHSKYLDNIVEQDHRLIKRRTNAGMGCGAYETAACTIAGYEVMHLLRTGQFGAGGKGGSHSQVQCIEQLFKIAA